MYTIVYIHSVYTLYFICWHVCIDAYIYIEYTYVLCLYIDKLQGWPDHYCISSTTIGFVGKLPAGSVEVLEAASKSLAGQWEILALN